MNEINEIKNPTTEVNEKPTRQELLERFAEIEKVTVEEAEQMVGGETEDKILDNIAQYTINKINGRPLNRAERRKLKKKTGKRYNGNIKEDITKINYINLIEQLRELNEQKQKEIEKNEDSTENN